MAGMLAVFSMGVMLGVFIYALCAGGGDDE